jgi:hypothetical protein
MTHLDSDVLAEFRAGLITGRRGARIAAHLAGCERCTSLDEQLAGVSALLASVPAPALPDHVAQRLDTVLAAEAARNNQPERTGRDGAGESAAPRRPRQNRGFRLLALRVLAPAAGVVLLAAGVFGLIRLSGSSSSSSAGSSAEGSAAQATAGAKSASGRVNAPAAAPQRMSPAIGVVTSPTNFTRAGFKQEAEKELTTAPALGPEQAASPQVQACVRNLTGHARLVLAESARYEGQSATLVVIRTGSGREALIAGGKCSATIRDVLDRTSLP